VIHSLFDTEFGTLAARSRAHLDNVATFTDTITGCAFGNAHLVPCDNGRMNLLHHGCLYLTEKEYTLVFVQETAAIPPTYKILRRETAVEEIRSVALE
jgi:hypothetical protein